MKPTMGTEYNLSNPSVAEEERMIQDRINEDYAYRQAMEEASLKAMEEAYYAQVGENQYYGHRIKKEA